MAGAANREGAYVATTDVSVVVGPAGKRRLITKGQAIPASVAITEVRMLVSVGLVAYIGSEQLGAVAAANPLEVPSKSALKEDWEAYVVAANIMTAEEASKTNKKGLIAEVDKQAAVVAELQKLVSGGGRGSGTGSTNPAGGSQGTGDDTVPPVPPGDPEKSTDPVAPGAPPADPEKPADPVNPGNGSEGKG